MSFSLSDELWGVLRREAVWEAERSYSPYSGIKVGAAAFGEDFKIFCGTNVENASYGLTLCAESSLVSNMVSEAEYLLKAIVTCDKEGELLAPCGRCRQVLAEFSDDETLILTPDGPKKFLDLLPWSFGPGDLG